ncbi:MAG: hypothetical protein GY729_19880 [Desulfobacteraceae bacterium]|nr:hypothetical protein [Desulfobacteraceae bacterium]
MAKKQLMENAKQWRVVAFIVVIAVAFFVFISLVYYKKNHKTPAQVSTKSAKPHVSGVIGGGAGSEQYNADLRKYGSREAEKAERRGQSYIPPVIKEREEKVIKAFEDMGVPKPPVIQKPVPKKRIQMPAKQVVVEKKETQREKILKSAILGEIDQISGKLSYSGHSTKVFEKIKSETSEVKVVTKAVNRVAADNSEDKIGSVDNLYQTLVKPGDVFYAVNNQTLNSDIPAGVGTATILSGNLKNARVIGRFSQENEHLVLEYNKLVMPDGTFYNITGYAVDPSNLSAGVRTSVDHHYIQRWGGLLAASFLEGFGQAVEQSGSTSIFSLDSNSVVQTYPEYDTGEQAWVAAGKIGEKLADQVANNFNRSPTVILNTGEPIGVLIIDIKKDS